MERKSIMTALIGKTIGGIAYNDQGFFEIWPADPRDGILFTVNCHGIFDADGNYFDDGEVPDAANTEAA